jgi:hypothetical protein
LPSNRVESALEIYVGDKRKIPEVFTEARPLVILSAAKDLMPVAIGDEVLRFAQDDRA